jgi:hypothetical protein
MGTKLDFKKTLKHLYNPNKHEIHIVDVPKMNFLMIDGLGNPAMSIEYQQVVETLYSLAYGIKFALKSLGHDYIVPPLEGLWWMENMNEFNLANKDRWKYTMMIMQPEWVTQDWVQRVMETTSKKKKLPLVPKLKLETYDEGLSVQILYTGAYVNETATIAEMHQFIKSNGYTTNGKHHEIYIGDPRKTSPEKLQTILRQPIRKG